MFCRKRAAILPSTAAGASAPGTCRPFMLHPISLLSVDRRTIPKAGRFKILMLIYSLPTDPIIHLCLCKGQDRQNLVCSGCGGQRESPVWVVLHPARGEHFPRGAERPQLSGRSRKGNIQRRILQSLCSCYAMRYV